MNSSNVRASDQVEGSAFAMLNPCVDGFGTQADVPTGQGPQASATATREAPTTGYVHPGPDVIASGFQAARLIGPQLEVAADSNASMKPDYKTRRICGVVTISNHSSWKPKGIGAVPPSVVEGMGLQTAAIFALAYNQSEHARYKHRWALVTNRGTVLILSGIGAADRPLNPAGFPPCVQCGLTLGQAESIALEANHPRYAMAIIPREWTISVRRADQVDERAHGEEVAA